MFQTQNKTYTESDFSDIVRAFEGGILKHKIELDSNSKKFDMKAKYVPNWACIWNKPNNIRRSCSIIMKDDKLAMVQFDDEKIVLQKDVLSHLYRLEDLSKI